MNKRSRRKMLVAMVIFGVSIATVLALTAFDENLLYFYSPTQIHAGEAPQNRSFRVGGLVVDGSVRREENSLAVQFDLTDNAEVVPVTYTGILPDLFREGQGIVAMGRLDASGLFVADEVLAKHDENYMPPEVADALNTAHEAGNQANPQPTKALYI
jgi:cytochrome c-type biogenesis protein CcmE